MDGAEEGGGDLEQSVDYDWEEMSKSNQENKRMATEPPPSKVPRKNPDSSGEDCILQLEAANDTEIKCGQCEDTVLKYNEKNTLCMHVKSDTLYGLDKKEIDQFKFNFLRHVCALRNSNGGILLIHVQDRNEKYGRSLDKFDERFEEDLSRMIEDDSMYHKHYTKRDWVSSKEGKYQDYIVLFLEGTSTISTKDYNTFMPRYGQIVRPKAREMAKYIKEVKSISKRNQYPSDVKEEKWNFSEGDKINFYESTDTQFKRLKDKDVQRGHNRAKGVACRIVDLRLYDYITSFSKLENGGRIYFGIEEDNKKFHYIVNGIQLTANEEDEVERVLYDKISKEMLWLREEDTKISPEKVKEEVTIQFHRTYKGNPNKYVIVVRVLRQFDGLVFTKKHGPNVYRIENGNIETVDVDEWKTRIVLKKA